MLRRKVKKIGHQEWNEDIFLDFWKNVKNNASLTINDKRTAQITDDTN